MWSNGYLDADHEPYSSFTNKILKLKKSPPPQSGALKWRAAFCSVLTEAGWCNAVRLHQMSYWDRKTAGAAPAPRLWRGNNQEVQKDHCIYSTFSKIKEAECRLENAEDLFRGQSISACCEVSPVRCLKSFVSTVSGEGDAGRRDGTQRSGGAGVVSEPES